MLKKPQGTKKTLKRPLSLINTFTVNCEKSATLRETLTSAFGDVGRYCCAILIQYLLREAEQMG